MITNGFPNNLLPHQDDEENALDTTVRLHENYPQYPQYLEIIQFLLSDDNRTLFFFTGSQENPKVPKIFN